MGTDDLYRVLGVARDADVNEIRKAFKKQAMQHHPDKGGDPEKFKKLQHAHEILTDERRRQIYDMTGSEDGEMGGGGPGRGPGGFPFDIGSIFGNMANFGGMGMAGMFPGMGGGMKSGPGSRVRRPKAPPKIQEIPLRLYDYYHGRTFHVKFDRQKFCEQCKGEGATSFQSCSPCQGRGIKRQVVVMGPMHMVNEGPCGDCNGAGKVASGSCYMCSGKKTRNQEKILEVKIEPGMKPGEVLVFPNECSDDPNYDEPGDVHFILVEAGGDDGWTRQGDDLHTDIHINLVDSLLGCKRTLNGHPGYADGLEIIVPVGTMNNEVITIQEKGMIKKGSAAGFGTLFCRIHVSVTEKEHNCLKENSGILNTIFNGIIS